MRIAQIATLARPVPPNGEGSVELLVSLLTEELVRRGHEVTLFALPSSRTSARLSSPVRQSYADGAGEGWDWQLYEAFQVREAFRRWREFDAIHCHSYHHGLLFCDFVPIPSLHSIHIEPGPDYRFLARRTANRALLFCSRHQARGFDDIPGTHIVPHGLDLDDCEPLPDSERGGYLAYLGRFIPGKGADLAVDYALESGIPLRLAGPRSPWFDEAIAPRLRPGLVDYAGSLDSADARRFLARSEALLYPIRDGEPFGLVLAEAMACGAPVVAFGRGAVPEIVEHGATGFIAEDGPGFVRGIRACAALDRGAVSARAKELFGHRRMAQSVERILASLHQGRNDP